MAEHKRDLAFWTLWATIASALIAAGIGLPHFGHPVAGKWLLYAGVAFVALCILASIVPALRKTLSVTSAAVLKTLGATWHFIGEAYAWLGTLLLGPIIRRVLQEKGLAQTQALSWTAERPLGQQGSDFLPIAQRGYRVVGARFVVRADHQYSRYHAGFRLTPAAENVEAADLKATILFDVELTSMDTQPKLWCHREGMSWGPYGLRWNSSFPTPSFEFDFSVYGSRAGGKFQVVCSINGDTPQALDLPAQFAEQLVLVAWSDRRDFRVYFEQISVSWTPI